MFDLQNKVAVITGGNGGIGFGMAQGLATAGARIVIAARNTAKSAAAVELLNTSGGRSLAIQVDVTDEPSVDRLFEQTLDRCGSVDILINNAGINIRKPVQSLALEEWQQVVATNLDSAFLCCRAAYPHLKSAGAGKIINIGSMLSIFGAGFAPAYGASKGGIVQLTKSLASAWAADNILRPILVSRYAPVSAFMVFVGVVGGIGAFGAIGIVVGPVFLALVAAIINYFDEKVIAPNKRRLDAQADDDRPPPMPGL